MSLNLPLSTYAHPNNIDITEIEIMDTPIFFVKQIVGSGTITTRAKSPKSNWATGNDLGLAYVLKGMLRRL